MVYIYFSHTETIFCIQGLYPNISNKDYNLLTDYIVILIRKQYPLQHHLPHTTYSCIRKSVYPSVENTVLRMLMHK